MSYKTFTMKQDVVAVDIQTMGDMSMEDYNEYLRSGLLNVDHHDILRSEPAGYPLAVTKKQFKALMDYLKEIEPKVGISNPG
ncbi:hypothetical protein [Curvibacter lanceolatus]|uniref:hypothetical protein n=1 Tax=Curvibacter lanceolatus TaxID=86182 RepID=UPI00035D6502|nr:hypothetical protein [Curvibacter lanceolatus]